MLFSRTHSSSTPVARSSNRTACVSNFRHIPACACKRENGLSSLCRGNNPQILFNYASDEIQCVQHEERIERLCVEMLKMFQFNEIKGFRDRMCKIKCCAENALPTRTRVLTCILFYWHFTAHTYPCTVRHANWETCSIVATAWQ